MRYLIICSFLLTQFIQKGNSQNYSIASLPLKSVLEGSQSIVRNDHYQVEIHSPSKMTVKRKKAVTYLKKTDADISPILHYDDQSTIKEFLLKVYNSDGDLVNEYKKRDARDVAHLSYSIYEDNRLLYFDLGKFDFPLTVEYEYEKRYDGIMYYEPWRLQDFDQSIEKSELEIIIPEEMELFHRAQNIDIDETLVYSGKNKIYRWEIQNVESIPSEKYTPHAYNILPSIQFGTNKFEIEKYSGSYENWNTFGQFLDQFYADAQELPESVEQEIRALTQPLSDDIAKIGVLYDYLQEKTRYVSVQIGIGGWKTYDAAYVAQHQYGDCKALSNYMAALLKSAGVEAVPVIIERSHNPYVLSDDFVFNRFNHAILYVPSLHQFIECTADSGPEFYIGSSNEGRKILLVDGEDSRIAETPKTSIDQNLKSSFSRINIGKNGMATIKTFQTNQFHRQEKYRAMLTSLDQSSFDKSFRSSFPITIQSLDSFQYSIEEEEPIVNIEYKLSSKEVVTPLGKRLFININPLFRTSTFLPEKEDRRSPLYISDYGIDSNTYHFVIPENYELESQPSSPIVIDSKWGKYRMSIELQNDKLLEVKRYFKFYPVQESADQYIEIKEFYDQIHKADKETKVVFVKK